MANKQASLPVKRLIGYTIYTILVIAAFGYAGQLFTNFEPQPERLVQMATTITAKAEGGKLREGASVDSPVIRAVRPAEEFTLLGYDNFFYHIRDAEGAEGYIANWLVEAEGAPMTELAHFAKTQLPSLPHTIVLDPGHGGEDPGAINDVLYEKEITLQTATFLQEKLENSGAKVIMTRTDDTFVSLEDRVALANSSDADLFFSLHYDASENPEDTGTTTYYYNKKSSQGLAESINPYLMEELPLPNNGIRFGDYQVIRDTDMPGLLFELGYMSNPKDIAAFSQESYQEQAAQSIFDGLVMMQWAKYYPTVPDLYGKYMVGLISLLIMVSAGYFILDWVQAKQAPAGKLYLSVRTGRKPQ